MTAQDRINEYWTGRAPDYHAYQQRPERFAADNAAWAEIWKEALPPAPLDVLDVGTGSGYVAMTLAGLGHRVTGIDLSTGMLDQARRHAASLPAPAEFAPTSAEPAPGTAKPAPGSAKPAPRSAEPVPAYAAALLPSAVVPPVFIEGDAVAPDFPDASFDAIVGRYVMWTLRSPEAAIANWKRLLRPDGRIAMIDSTWFPDGLENASENFGHFYDEEVRSLLPLAAAKSIDETTIVLANAGLRDVTVTPLTSIMRLDQQHGVAPGHEVQMQFLISGRL
ncbi:class I SAM-dependent methyltransferase [Actinoplanes sp. DH11]|uniref:class I SAM-dependent methyltransferase n=1 Tax=Actinoplanes sp. DH11 TaxID=2857011 RepID=UPI001E40A6D9|nr:class I SAM-dependent methyltransferase [Actinoplanes sp. DH11]